MDTLYIWIQSKEAVKLEYYWRVISGQSGERLLICLALGLATSRHQVA